MVCAGKWWHTLRTAWQCTPHAFRSFAGEALERERFGAHVTESYQAGIAFAGAKANLESLNRCMGRACGSSRIEELHTPARSHCTARQHSRSCALQVLPCTGMGKGIARQCSGS